MYRMILLALVVGLGAVACAADGDRPDLSGKWNADLANSDFALESVPESLAYVVEHKNRTIHVEYVRQTDGKETKTERTLEGRWEGARLLFNYHTTYQGGR
jgi:hypothetical protein